MQHTEIEEGTEEIKEIKDELVKRAYDEGLVNGYLQARQLFRSSEEKKKARKSGRRISGVLGRHHNNSSNRNSNSAHNLRNWLPLKENGGRGKTTKRDRSTKKEIGGGSRGHERKAKCKNTKRT